VLDPAKVPGALFADVGDEVDRPLRPHAGGAHGFRHREQHREAAAIVTDARALEQRPLTLDADVGLLRKNGIEVRRQDHDGTTPRARALGDHVPDRVDANVAQTERFEPAFHLSGTPFLLERGGRDLADRHLLVDRPGVVGADAIDRRSYGGVWRSLTLRVRDAGNGNGEQEGARKDESH
jgi:hypothetical protein